MPLNPIVVHVVRPYGSEQEYLSAEAWSIDQRSMLLIEAEALPPDTVLLFDVALSDGQKLIRAEGRVVGSVAPNGERPGGLRVRFKRFGAATKAFIERAVQAKGGVAVGSSPVAAAEIDRVSMPEVRLSMTNLEALSPAAPPVTSAPPPRPSEREPSGVRQRAAGPVPAPANREELLQRLRQRRQTG